MVTRHWSFVIPPTPFERSRIGQDRCLHPEPSNAEACIQTTRRSGVRQHLTDEAYSRPPTNSKGHPAHRLKAFGVRFDGSNSIFHLYHARKPSAIVCNSIWGAEVARPIDTPMGCTIRERPRNLNNRRCTPVRHIPKPTMVCWATWTARLLVLRRPWESLKPNRETTSLDLTMLPIIYPERVDGFRKRDVNANWRQRPNESQKLTFVGRRSDDRELPPHIRHHSCWPTIIVTQRRPQTSGFRIHSIRYSG